jgi:hypothetical protein
MSAEAQGSTAAGETVSSAVPVADGLSSGGERLVGRGSGSVAVSAVGVPRPAEPVDAVPALEEAAEAAEGDEPAAESAQEKATGWDNTAVSSAVPEPKPRKG